MVKGVSPELKGELVGKFPVVTPAFIDAHCHIGMERSGEPRSEGESNEHMDPLLFLADALDSVQMDDQAFQDSVEMGVLYSCVLPGSGNIVGGRAAVIRNHAANTTEALVARSRDQGRLRLQPDVHPRLERHAALHPHGGALPPARPARRGALQAGAARRDHRRPRRTP